MHALSIRPPLADAFKKRHCHDAGTETTKDSRSAPPASVAASAAAAAAAEGAARSYVNIHEVCEGWRSRICTDKVSTVKKK